MKPFGFAIVAGTFIGVALVVHAIIRAIQWEPDAALGAGAIVATQVGTVIWHRQAPATPVLSVKLGLGGLLSVTAVVFALVLQWIVRWLEYPEVVVPIAAIGCFVFPFVLVGPMWKSLSKGNSSGSGNA